jgi:pimeloyl-ACP methyl ester carboxylesterase
MSGQTFTATTAAGPIAGQVHGDDGPAVLLMHGGPGLTDYMGLLEDELAGWRWISYQQRGLAPSATNGPFTIEQHVADAVAVLDELDLGQVVVLGHSWGGHLAMHFALAHPERVTALIAVDPLGAVGDGGAGEHGQHLAERLSPEAAEKYAVVAAKLAEPEPTDADMLESLALLWPSYYADPATAPPIPAFLRCSLAGYVGTFTSVAEQLAGGFADRLGAVTVPAVFVLGDRSPMPLTQGQQTAALFPAGQVKVIAGAGHLPWHEQPGCVAAALTSVAER